MHVRNISWKCLRAYDLEDSQPFSSALVQGREQFLFPPSSMRASYGGTGGRRDLKRCDVLCQTPYGVHVVTNPARAQDARRGPPALDTSGFTMITTCSIPGKEGERPRPQQDGEKGGEKTRQGWAHRRRRHTVVTTTCMRRENWQRDDASFHTAIAGGVCSEIYGGGGRVLQSMAPS